MLGSPQTGTCQYRPHHSASQLLHQTQGCLHAGRIYHGTTYVHYLISPNWLPDISYNVSFKNLLYIKMFPFIDGCIYSHYLSAGQCKDFAKRSYMTVNLSWKYMQWLKWAVHYFVFFVVILDRQRIKLWCWNCNQGGSEILLTRRKFFNVVIIFLIQYCKAP